MLISFIGVARDQLVSLLQGWLTLVLEGWIHVGFFIWAETTFTEGRRTPVRKA